MKKVKLNEFLVLVTIENKSYVSDPEGETIFRDLISKGGFSSITKVRVAKSLKLTVMAEDKSRAEKTVRIMCEELRIYNSIVSDCTVTTISKLSKPHSRNPKMIW